MMASSRFSLLAAAHTLLILTFTISGWTIQNTANPSSGPTQEKQEVQAPPTESAPTPIRSIDLESMNFRRLSPLRSRDGSFHITITFFDENHLLLTYEGPEMVRRQRNCPSTHDDRMVHAIVVDAENGKVLHRADWYLHDRQQYLWPLASGEMLFRRGDQLIELDQDLKEKVILDHKDLFWTDITPDGQQIVAGVAADSDKESSKAQKRTYEARFMDAASLNVAGTMPLERPIPQRVTSDGYADVILKNGWTWLVRFGPHGQPRRSITRVRSSCIPNLDVSGAKTLLIGRCTTAQDRYVISSFSTDGQFLWRHRWSEQLNIPLIARSTSGIRFALSVVDVVKESNPEAAEGEDAGREVRRHRIEVFNAATGTSVLKVETHPAITVGGNVALSPDATRLAVLRDSRVEIYELPALEKEEAAKLAAVRAGTPGLIPPGERGDSDEDAELADDDLSTKRLENFAAVNLQPEMTSAAASTPNAQLENAAVAPGPPPDKPELIFHSRAEAVTVDILVTDSKGRPVPGLQANDFSVSEDGTVQKVNYFKEHSVIDTHITPPPDYKRPPNIFSNVSNTTQPDSSTLILFDMVKIGRASCR